MNTKQKTKCNCGYSFGKHTRIDMNEVSKGLGIIYVCPNNTSGLAPSIFKKVVGRRVCH